MIHSTYWDVPETIPLLCSLLPNLLVKFAEMTMETKSEKKGPCTVPPKNKKLKNSEKLLQKYFKKCKANGRSYCKSDKARIVYLRAKADLQKTRRYQDNLSVIRGNNQLMNAHARNRNWIYAKMKKIRGQNFSTKPLVLETLVGSYTGDDVLEGFAADVEYLGRARGESSSYENELYRLCKLDNEYIFEFKGSKELQYFW